MATLKYKGVDIMSTINEGAFDMTKSELILTIKPLLRLLDQGDVEGVKEILREVLEEASSKK
jgi:hypothetical protein